MTRTTLLMVLTLSLPACDCNKDVDDTAPPEGDTDTDTDADGDTDTDADGDTDADTDTDTDTDCTATVVETLPEAEEERWYYRDALEVTFSEPAVDLASIVLTDEEGGEVATTITWESSDYLALVQADALLAGSSAYLLSIEICDELTEVAFSTDVYGDELEEEVSTLEHNTYVLDLEEVTFTEPENFELLLGMFGVNPLLVGIETANETDLVLFVAEGKKRSDGSYKLLDDGRSWLFEPADFTAQPYFSAEQAELSLDYDGVELPIQDFLLEGTFAPDGSSIGGVTVAGVADTRQLSAAFGDDESYFCDLMGDWGIHCIACDDGAELCIDILAEDGKAPLEEGLDIIP
jgi:hypothetical protein